MSNGAATQNHASKKTSRILPDAIYRATTRTEFLSLIEKARGENMAKLFGEIGIDSGACLATIDVFAEIQSGYDLLSDETKKYVFKQGTNNLRMAVEFNIKRLVEQMKHSSTKKSDGKHSHDVEPDSLSSSSSSVQSSVKRQKCHSFRKRKHRSESKRKEVSFSSGDHGDNQSVSSNRTSSEERLEHLLTTSTRIDYFLQKYCKVQPNDLSSVKIKLTHECKLYEEQLYELLMSLRNSAIRMKKLSQVDFKKTDVVNTLVEFLNGLKPIGFDQND